LPAPTAKLPALTAKLAALTARLPAPTAMLPVETARLKVRAAKLAEGTRPGVRAAGRGRIAPVERAGGEAGWRKGGAATRETAV
jgi:hypothetical protein